MELNRLKRVLLALGVKAPELKLALRDTLDWLHENEKPFNELSVEASSGRRAEQILLRHARRVFDQGDLDGAYEHLNAQFRLSAVQSDTKDQSCNTESSD